VPATSPLRVKLAQCPPSLIQPEKLLHHPPAQNEVLMVMPASAVQGNNAFNRVDHEIWRALWQWARPRHLKKSPELVKKQYFPAQRNRA
jgi:hypothetical protein